MSKARPEIEMWLITRVAELTKKPPGQISPDVRFEEYGIDSAGAVGLTGELEVWLDQVIDPSLAFECPTIAKLAKRLADHG